MKRLLSVIAFVSLSACGRTTELPPNGEVLLVVDTDLSVPALAGRLRVDVFSEEGTWLDSRDIGRSDPRDWPASFSVFSDDDTRVRSALVRLRVYPEGAVSPYTGEKEVQTARFVERHVATNVDDLCQSAPELPLGGTITGRLGTSMITEHVTKPECKSGTQGGAIAARVNVTRPGTYRFSVADTSPFITWVALSLRTACTDPSSQATCRTEVLREGINSTGHFPRFDAHLDGGSYWLVATSLLPGQPADVTLDFYPVDAPLPVAQPSSTSEAAKPATPRLLRDGEDRTPQTEPSESASVDRLVLVRVAPNERGTARVVLRGACAGVRAQLSARAYEVDIASAATCTEIEGTRAPIVATPIEPSIVRDTASVQGTFGPNEPCPATAAGAPRICIPGGVFLLGTRVLSPLADPKTEPAPLRMAMMPRFSIDRSEVSVGRFRDAIAKGFAYDAAQIRVNDAGFPLSVNPQNLPSFDGWCSWSSRPLGREEHALTCMTWDLARAFCQHEGGELPTEAEWEYVATAAGRKFKTDYPWGSDEPPLCERAVFYRYKELGGELQGCGVYPGPAPIAESDGRDGRLPDATPLGVVGLAGGVQEWVKDSALTRYDSACWVASGLRSPQCWEEHAPWRSIRGGAWSAGPVPLVLRNAGPPSFAGRGIQDIFVADPSIGFRCAYHEAHR